MEGLLLALSIISLGFFGTNCTGNPGGFGTYVILPVLSPGRSNPEVTDLSGLDLEAIYKTTANPAVLLNNASFNRKIPVEVSIGIKDYVETLTPRTIHYKIYHTSEVNLNGSSFLFNEAVEFEVDL